MSKLVRIRTGIEAEADFLKSDNICLCIIFYDEKQFINQSDKVVVQQKNNHYQSTTSI